MVDSGNTSLERIDVEGMGAILAQQDIVFAILFGSLARGNGNETSDVDVALKFPDDMSRHERFRTRNRIDADLQAYADGFVDVSDIDSIPIPVAYAALRDGIVISGEKERVAEYHETIAEAYEATADERERERKAFIDRLARGDT